MYEESCEDEMPTLSGFLEEVALVADIDSLDENSDYVVLMTLHSAKGLEFPNVYLVGMEDGIFPSYMTMMADDPTEIEEERRLCYVGITRAMDNLTLTCAKRRMMHGETQYNKMSRFLKEIPSYLFMTKATAVRQEFEPPKQTIYTRQPVMQQKPIQNFGAKSGELEYGIGDRVRHMKFGEGQVLELVKGGRDYEVTVEFDQVGVKKMFAGFAKLQKL